jgi:hypothetical protein
MEKSSSYRIESQALCRRRSKSAWGRQLTASTRGPNQRNNHGLFQEMRFEVYLGAEQNPTIAEGVENRNALGRF